MSDKSYITTNLACVEMWRNSRPNNQASIEMWRNAVSDMEQTNSQSTVQRPPSALSDSDDMSPLQALSDSDAPPPSALSDDFRLPSPLISDAGSLRLAVSAMNIASAKYQSIVNHGRSGQDEGYFAREPCSRASFSSTLAETGSTVCLTSERAVQWVVERERVLNNRVQEAVEAAEESLVELLRLVTRVSGVSLREVQDEAPGTVASLATVGHGKVSFVVDNHPEDRDPIRPGTPGPSRDDYFADDEQESPGAPRRRRARSSGRPSGPAPFPAIPETLQSPAHILRALKSSEIWDEDTPAEPALHAPAPALHAPAPLRPLRELESLLARHDGMTETKKELK